MSAIAELVFLLAREPARRVRIAVRRSILAAIGCAILLVAVGLALAALGIVLGREFGLVAALSVYAVGFFILGAIFLLVAARVPRDLRTAPGTEHLGAQTGASGASPMALAVAFAAGFAAGLRRRS